MQPPGPRQVAIVVGAGVVGRAIHDSLVECGWGVVPATRRGTDGVVFDGSLPDAPERLRSLVTDHGATWIVLAQGSSDVDWCEANEEAALFANRRTVEAALATGVETLLISSDCVFDGTSELSFETDPFAPAHAYGRSKVEAESVFVALGGRAILRLSMVIGWAPAGTRQGFIEQCIIDLAAGRDVDAPSDQFFTPVFCDDVGSTARAMLTAPTMPGVVHCAGPERLSRFEAAVRIADLIGRDRAHVHEVVRAGTRWENRPRNSCLGSTRTEPWLPPARDFDTAVRAMLAGDHGRILV